MPARSADAGTGLMSAASLILQACRERDAEGGIRQEVLEQQLSHIQRQHLLSALNELMTQGKVVACPGHNKKLVFRLQSEREVARLQGLSAEDRLIYQEIERSEGSGISTKDLRARSGMQHQPLSKILKTLETRKLVRPVKSVAAKNKKLYMLYDVEAAKEVTGGAWYSESQEFDHELISHLQQACSW